jgi:hypothetical protein
MGKITKHKAQIESLKSKDPEFYKFLEENDQQALSFGEGDRDEAVDEDDEADEDDEDDEDSYEKKVSPVNTDEDEMTRWNVDNGHVSKSRKDERKKDSRKKDSRKKDNDNDNTKQPELSRKKDQKNKKKRDSSMSNTYFHDSMGFLKTNNMSLRNLQDLNKLNDNNKLQEEHQKSKAQFKLNL